MKAEWTDEEDMYLRTLIAAGKSYLEIAGLLGRTRSSVAGRANRQLVERPKETAEETARKREARRRAHIARQIKYQKKRAANGWKANSKKKAIKKEAVPKEQPQLREVVHEPVAAQADQAMLHVSLVDLNSKHCRWPLDDGTYCGCRRTHRSYCDHHAKIAFVPIRPYNRPSYRARPPHSA